MNDDDQILLNKYLDGNISEEEMTALQKKLLACDDLADEFAKITRLDYVIEQSFVEESADSISNKTNPLTTPKPKSLFLNPFILAATLLLAGVLIYQSSFGSKNNDRLHAKADLINKQTNMPSGRNSSSGTIAKPDESGVPKIIRFGQHVLPILSDKCYFCHGPDKDNRKGKLRLDIREEAIKTKAIVPGKPEESELITRIMLPADDDDVMPTEKSHKTLSKVEKAILKKWVASGAKYETHWAYTPIALKANLSLDQFVAQRLKAEGLKSSKTADARTLTRRLYLDLTGLPPKPEDLPKAGTNLSTIDTEKLIDQLLASPQYGERMATWWLDAVRYANTIGYHGDIPMPSSPYRNYVIRAFNDNKPFDQFTIEQIAGDLIPNANQEQKIAAGYCRLNQISQEGGIQDKEYVKKYQSERVRTTATAWMGATLMCSECHDHKFDPYTQKDFYSFAAFFADILEKGAYTRVGKYNDDIKKYKSDTIIIGKSPYSLNRTAGAVMVLTTPEQDALLKKTTDAKEKQKILKGLMGTMATISAKPREVRILNRGNWMDEKGEIVLPATPSFLPAYISSTEEKRLTRMDLAKWIVNKKNPLTARVFANRMWAMFFQTGLSSVVNNFGLQGEWPEHPELLDSLAKDFMESDWNVKKLVKKIVMSKTYLQSSQGSQALQKRDPVNRLLARQTPRRLDGEFIRDSALASSGLLSSKMFGDSVYPYQPDNYWQHLKFPNRKYKASQGEDQYRRGVYTHWQRTFLHPMLRTFDAPSRDECAMSRPQSNTPLQALVLMNDPTFVEAARVLADKLSTLKSDQQKIQMAYLTILSRDPTTQEIKILRELLKRERQRVKANPKLAETFQTVGDYKIIKQGNELLEATALSAMTRTIYNLHESITRY